MGLLVEFQDGIVGLGRNPPSAKGLQAEVLIPARLREKTARPRHPQYPYEIKVRYEGAPKGGKRVYVADPTHAKPTSNVIALPIDLAAYRKKHKFPSKFDMPFPEGHPLYDADQTMREAEVHINRVLYGKDNCFVLSSEPGYGKSRLAKKLIADYQQLLHAKKLPKGSPGLIVVEPTDVSKAGLYDLMSMNSTRDHLLLFDDCDGMLNDHEVFPMLLQALGRDRVRRIQRALGRNTVISFPLEARVLVLTNINLQQRRKENPNDTISKAVSDRVDDLRLSLSNPVDQAAWLVWWARKVGMLQNLGLNAQQAEEAFEFFESNFHIFDKKSLRALETIVKCMKSPVDFPDWRKSALMLLKRRP